MKNETRNPANHPEQERLNHEVLSAMRTKYDLESCAVLHLQFSVRRYAASVYKIVEACYEHETLLEDDFKAHDLPDYLLLLGIKPEKFTEAIATCNAIFNASQILFEESLAVTKIANPFSTKRI